MRVRFTIVRCKVDIVWTRYPQSPHFMESALNRVLFSKTTRKAGSRVRSGRETDVSDKCDLGHQQNEGVKLRINWVTLSKRTLRHLRTCQMSCHERDSLERMRAELTHSLSSHHL